MPEAGKDVGEPRVGTCDGARVFQETGFVMQGEDEAVDFKGHLVRIRVSMQLTHFLCLHNGTMHGREPCLDRIGQPA